MRRRDMLKGAAVAAGVSVVGSATEMAEARERIQREYDPKWLNKAGLARKVDSLLKVSLEVTPCGGDPPLFAPCFQRRMEQWAEYWEGGFRPVGEFYFELCKGLSKGGYARARQWLMHPKWAEPPLGPTILRPQRWGVIDRAVFFRCHAYWRQNHPRPPAHLRLTEDGRPFKQWKAQQLRQLHHIMVHFDAELVEGTQP